MSVCVYPGFHKRPLFLTETQNVDIFTTKGITESQTCIFIDFLSETTYRDST